MTEKQKRDRRVKKELLEKQRKDLKILVGLNLQRLSGLDGVDLEVYSKTVLPEFWNRSRIVVTSLHRST